MSLFRLISPTLVFLVIVNTWFNLSSTLQIQWLKQSGFGGAMVWSLDLDDFSGTFCGQGRYPLINTLKSGLGTGASTYEPHILLL